MCTQIARAANTRKGFPSRQQDGATDWVSTLPRDDRSCEIYLNLGGLEEITVEIDDPSQTSKKTVEA